MSGVIDLVNGVLELLMIVFFFTFLLTPRWKTGYTVLLWALIDGIPAIASLYVREQFGNLRGIAVLFLMAVAVFVIYRDRWRRKLTVFLVYLALLLLTETCSTLLYHGIAGTWTVDYHSVARYVSVSAGMIVFSSVAALTALIASRPRRSELVLLSLFQALFTVLELSFLYVAMANGSGILGDRQAVYLALLSVPTVTFNLLFVSSVQVFSEARQRSREQEFMKERNENAFAYYQLAMENERRLSAVRHDLSNVLQTAFALVRNGREREGEALLQEFSAGFPRPLRYCDNEIINTVLAVKLQKIRQLPGGADADVHVTGPFGRLPLTDMQLTAVLNNLLDNAIEALAAYRESGKTDGQIGIRIGIRQGYFVINVRNPALHAAAEKGWFVKSSKRDAENHGLGLRIIREIAERAGGEFVITVSAQGEVSATAVFQMPEGDGGKEPDGQRQNR